MTRYLQGLEVKHDSIDAASLSPTRILPLNIFDARRAIMAVNGIEAIIGVPEQAASSAYTFLVLTEDLPPFEAGKVIEALRRIGNVRALPTITASGFWGLTDLQGGDKK